MCFCPILYNNSVNNSLLVAKRIDERLLQLTWLEADRIRERENARSGTLRNIILCLGKTIIVNTMYSLLV